MSEIKFFGNGTAQQIDYLHDDNGNQISRAQGTLVEVFTYDYANRMTGYTKQNSTSLETLDSAACTYMVTGERVQKQVLRQNGATVNQATASMYDGADVLADYDATMSSTSSR